MTVGFDDQGQYDRMGKAVRQVEKWQGGTAPPRGRTASGGWSVFVQVTGAAVGSRYPGRFAAWDSAAQAWELQPDECYVRDANDGPLAVDRFYHGRAVGEYNSLPLVEVGDGPTPTAVVLARVTGSTGSSPVRMTARLVVPTTTGTEDADPVVDYDDVRAWDGVTLFPTGTVVRLTGREPGSGTYWAVPAGAASDTLPGHVNLVAQTLGAGTKTVEGLDVTVNAAVHGSLTVDKTGTFNADREEGTNVFSIRGEATGPDYLLRASTEDTFNNQIVLGPVFSPTGFGGEWLPPASPFVSLCVSGRIISQPPHDLVSPYTGPGGNTVTASTQLAAGDGPSRGFWLCRMIDQDEVGGGEFGLLLGGVDEGPPATFYIDSFRSARYAVGPGLVGVFDVTNPNTSKNLLGDECQGGIVSSIGTATGTKADGKALVQASGAWSWQTVLTDASTLDGGTF